MKFTKTFTKVAATDDYYANWASGFNLPKTSLALTITDETGNVVWDRKYIKTQYNNATDMKKWLLADAKAAGF